MCTTFVYRKENVLIGMNFDNDGREVRLSTVRGKDFLVSVRVGKSFFPSFGVSQEGIFVNDLMVDSNGEGKYKRNTRIKQMLAYIWKGVIRKKTHRMPL